MRGPALTSLSPSLVVMWGTLRQMEFQMEFYNRILNGKFLIEKTK